MNDNLKLISRRRFLGGAGAALLALLSRAGVRFASAQEDARISRVALFVSDPQQVEIDRAVREAALAVTDMSWLKPGDSVFIKVASNSDLQSPAVTSPAVLRAVIGLLKEFGAGTIYVGDMSGAMFVRHLENETIGSTRENMRKNGLLAAAEEAGASVHCFEEVPFADAYIAGVPACDHHWGDELQVAEILDRVDAIVNLPRLGKHVLAGTSLGLKNAVGWISDYSRGALHRDGDVFQEKIAEINAIPQLANKQRLTLTLVDRALTTYGPDAGYTLPLSRPLIIASEDIVSHDQIALLTLLWARKQTPAAEIQKDPYPDESNGLNFWFVRVYWGEAFANLYRTLATYVDLADANIPSHINYAYEILHGGRPDKIQVVAGGLQPDEQLLHMLTANPDLRVEVG